MFGFVGVHVGSNNEVGGLRLSDCAVRRDRPLFAGQQPPAQQSPVVGIFVCMRTEQLFEFEQLVSRKSLNLAVRSDSFTSEPNEKLTVGPIRRRNVSRQQGPES